VLLAHQPGEWSARAEDRSPLAASSSAAPARAGLPTLALGLADALGDERHELLVAFVRQAVAYVLRLTDPDRLPRDQPLLDTGFDSLMAVELRNVLRSGLGLAHKLPTTMVFDHPNVTAIATYVERLMVTDGLLDGDESDDDAAGAIVSSADHDAVIDMTDDEVEALLLKKLSEMSRP
jgi:hypothetical protein